MPPPSSRTITRRRFQKVAAASALAVPLAAPLRALGSSERLGVGIIGCGGRGGTHLARLVQMRNDGEKIDLVAACDTYRPRLEAAAAAAGAAFKTMAHEDLLARKDVDVVLVATPDHWHGRQTLDAVRAGKDAYCEKPLVHWRQLDLPEKLVRAAEETGRIVQVGCQRMSCSAYAQARALVEEGAIGRPIVAETGYYRIGDWGERGMPIDDPAVRPGPDLDWKRFQGDAPEREFHVDRYFRWRMFWDYSGGPGTDNYVHFYTPLAYMLKLDVPELVVATGGKHRYEEREVPDTFHMLVEYPRKLSVICHGTQGNDHQSQGTGDHPILRGWEGTLTFEGNDLVVRPTGDVSRPEKRVAIERGTDERRFWADFLESCRTRRPVASDVRLGAAVATTLQMAMAAFREGRTVRWDAANRRIV